MPKTITDNDIYYLELIHKRLLDHYMEVLDDLDNLEPYGLRDEICWLKNFIIKHKKVV